LLLAAPPAARGDTSASDGKAAAPTMVSFHTSIGSPPPEDYVIDVHADGRVDVTVYLTYRRHTDGAIEFIDLKRKPRKKSRTATSAELEALRKLVTDPEMTKLKSEYKGTTWDVGSYRVMFVDGEKKQRTISTSMLAFGELPVPLQQVMSATRKLAGDLYRSP
jgi:hypothetical protein